MSAHLGRTLCLLFLVPCLPSSAQSPAPGADASVAQLVKAFGAARYPSEQAEVAQQLIAKHDRAAVWAIQPYLETPDRQRRCNAAFVLAGLGDERGMAALIAELRDDSAENRSTDVGRVNFAGHADPASIARQAMIGDRYYAAWVLGRLRDPSGVPALIDALKEKELAVGASFSLGQIGDRRAVPGLRDMLAEFPDQRVHAGYGLAALGEAQGFDVLEEIALTDPQWVTRRHAVEGLGNTRDRTAVPILLRTLHDEHVNVRVSSVRALAQIGDPAAVPALTAALDDTEVTPVNAPTTVAAEAKKALEAIGSTHKH